MPGQLGQHLLDHLKLGNLLAELAALAGIFDGAGKGPFDGA